MRKGRATPIWPPFPHSQGSPTRRAPRSRCSRASSSTPSPSAPNTTARRPSPSGAGRGGFSAALHELPQLTSGEVVARLVEIARELHHARHRHEKLGLSEEQEAFHDALAEASNTWAQSPHWPPLRMSGWRTSPRSPLCAGDPPVPAGDTGPSWRPHNRRTLAATPSRATVAPPIAPAEHPRSRRPRARTERAGAECPDVPAWGHTQWCIPSSHLPSYNPPIVEHSASVATTGADDEADRQRRNARP